MKLITMFLTFVLSTGLFGTHSFAAEFLVEINADPAELFELMTTISTPTAAPGRMSFVKFVTKAVAADIAIRVESPGRSAVNVSLAASGSVTDEDLVPVTDAVFLVEIPATDPANPIVAAGYRMFLLTIEYITEGNPNYPARFPDGETSDGETWQITIKEHPSGSVIEYFGFSGNTTEEVTSPRLLATERVDFTEVQRNVQLQNAPVEPIALRNVGTAQAFSVASTVAVNPESTFGANGRVSNLLPGEDQSNVWNEAIPGESEGFWISARPGAIDLFEGRADITYENFERNILGLTSTALSVEGVNLFMHMLIDVSGSMKRFPDSAGTAPVGERRIDKVKEAGNEIAFWLDEFSEHQAFVGLSTFPNRAENQNQAVLPIDTMLQNFNSIRNSFADVGGLEPGGGTPMREGLQVAIDDMSGSEFVVGNSGSGQQFEWDDLKKAILLLSDGYENSPTDSNPGARSLISTLDEKDILMYTVGYGIECPEGDEACPFPEVDLGLLQDLAAGPSIDQPDGSSLTGDFIHANGLDRNAIKNAFKQAIAPLLNIQPVLDPNGTIRRGQSRSHEACLDDRAYGVTFVVDWDNHIDDAIDLTLTTPKGDILTPSSAGVSYHETDDFAMYIIRGGLIRGGQGAGEWTMNLTGGQSISANEDTQYSYNVLAQSPIEAKPRFGFTWVGGLLLAQMELEGMTAVKQEDLQIQLDYAHPTQSYEAYLSQSVDPELIFGGKDKPGLRFNMLREARAETIINDREEPLVMRQVKAAALVREGKIFSPKIEQQTVKLVAKEGRYTANLGEITAEGVLDFYFRVDTLGARRNCVQREHVASQYVGILLNEATLTGAISWVDLRPNLFFDPRVFDALSDDVPDGFMLSVAEIKPRSGEIPWGMGKADQISVKVQNGEARFGVIDNWDGTYYQVVQHRDDQTPSVAVSIGAATSQAVAGGQSVPWWQKLPWWAWILLILIVIVIIWIRRP